ncbi:MAG: hypothetical protein NTW29_10455 [Bacteroidetes bacterium]|nr:hypothetical protein [Bacteroidota bacterium]
MIVKMSQGRDLVVSMFEPNGIYDIRRIFWTILAVTAFSVSMWIIPAFLFEKRKDSSGKSKDAVGTHLFFAHRAISQIPFWLLAFTLFNASGWLFVFFGILELVLLSFFNIYVTKKKKRLITMACLFAVFILLIIYFLRNYRIEYFRVKLALAGILYIFSIFVYLFYRWQDRIILNEHYYGDPNVSAVKRYKFNSFTYFTYFFINLIAFLSLLFNVFKIAPESILLYVFALYIFFIDIITYILRLNTFIKTSGVILAITILLLFVLNIFKFTVEHNAIDKPTLSEKYRGFKMLSFQDYYEKWKKRLPDDTNAVYPIILVAGEGGGSRAGFWFSKNLIDFDYRTHGLFRDHIFSISTVSGSSVGLSTYYAYLELPIHQKGSDSAIPAAYKEIPKEIYKSNFIGSSISGLLISDLLKTIFRTGSKTDRNNILMAEEKSCTQDAISRALNNSAFKDNKLPQTCMLEREYMSLFYDSTDNFKSFSMKLPLSFINTCRSNDGRRGIFSSVKLESSYFNDAIDISAYIYNDQELFKTNQINRSTKSEMEGIYLGQATVCSELFPIFSAPMYIDSLGSFVDGGYHENSGLKTTLDIYNKLKDLLDNDKKKKGKYAIYILYLKNGSEDKRLYQPKKPSLGITQPFSALLGQPFNGSASYFEEKARYIGDTSAQKAVSKLRTFFIKIPLDNKIPKDEILLTDTRVSKRIQKEIFNDLVQKNDTGFLNFPLARWLSVSVIDHMSVYQSRFSDSCKPLKSLLDQIKLAHH